MNIVRLVKRAQKGDKEALLQLIMSEKDAYYKLALTYLGNTHDAMDAMEDMIVTLYEKIDQLQKKEAFHSWSKSILVNSCRSMLRKRKQAVPTERLETSEEVELVHTLTSYQDPYSTTEQRLDLQDLLQHLNEYQREAIQLKYFHDMDNQTIADLTNVSIGTVKSRLFEGLKKLRGTYRGEKHE